MYGCRHVPRLLACSIHQIFRSCWDTEQKECQHKHVKCLMVCIIFITACSLCRHLVHWWVLQHVLALLNNAKSMHLPAMNNTKERTENVNTHIYTAWSMWWLNMKAAIVYFVICLVACPSSTCLTFCPNSRVLLVSAMLDARGLMFTNTHTYVLYLEQVLHECWM